MSDLKQEDYHAKMNELWQEYLALAERNEAIPPPIFGFHMISWTAQMLYDTAPNEATSDLLIKDATAHGKGNHKREKEEEKNTGEIEA